MGRHRYSYNRNTEGRVPDKIEPNPKLPNYTNILLGVFFGFLFIILIIYLLKTNL